MKDSYTVLAVDTSTDMLACAVGRLSVGPDGVPCDFELLGSADQLCRRHANEQLVNVVDGLLAVCGLDRGALDAVLCGTGPGSFTGVRIGVATAKGIACGLSVPLYGVSTLDAVAWGTWKAGVRGLVGVVGDAMRKEVYPALYQVGEEGPERLFACETVMKAPEAAALWAQRPDAADITLAGDGLKKYRTLYEEAGFTRFAPDEAWYPTGEGLLRASFSAEVPPRSNAGSDSQGAQGRSVLDVRESLRNAASQVPQHSGDPALVLPVYTRLSDAEENERIRLGRPEPQTMRLTGVDDALGDVHLQLRPMNVNDLAAVAALEAAVFSEAHHEPWTEQVFYDDFTTPGHIWWVAHDQGNIVGYAGGAFVEGELQVANVAVAPERRGQGIAGRLLERVSYDAQMLGGTTAVLEVEVGNDSAVALYTRLGFAEAGRRKGYYGPGHDATVMTADLPLLDRRAPADLEAAPHPTGRVWPPAPVARSTAELEALSAAGPLILAVESSCDETAVAVIDGAGVMRANVVATQIDFHARFGGVVPEIASRKHTEAIVGVYEEAMAQAAESLGLGAPLLPGELAAVAVTQGPGLVGALVVGVAFSKGLAWAANKPLVCVNHLEGHLYANLFETPDLEPPFVASLLSGGHTMLVHVRAWGDYEVLGETLDDAVGEAFDKVAKALGLGYPGGPIISRLAKAGNLKAIDFPRAMMHSHDYRFSLSGLKTAVVTYINSENAAGRAINLPDLAASFEAAVIDVQVSKALTAVRECGARDFCAGGGVTANPELRDAYRTAFGRRKVRVTLPPLSACTDNAAMIALVAKGKFERGEFSPLTADADPNMGLE